MWNIVKHRMNFTSADKVCSSVCPALCAFAMSASGIRKSLDSSLDLRVTHWKALHLYAEFLGFTVFSHHSTRSSMDRACSPVRLCARLWRQNSLWGLPNTGGNAFYVTSANPRFVSLPQGIGAASWILVVFHCQLLKSFGCFCTTNPQLGHPVMPNAPGQQSGYLQ